MNLSNQELKKYKKEFNFSYCFGVYPIIELLKKPNVNLIKIIASDKAKKSHKFEDIAKICKSRNIPIEFSKKILNRIAANESILIIGIFKKFETKLDPKESHLMLVNPDDAGNLGTIIRTISGFGITNLAIITPSVDIFLPKTIRASMGSIFSINFQFFTSFEEYQKLFSDHIFYPFVLNGKKNLNEINFEKLSTLIFGNEGKGLDPKFESFSNSVKILHEKSIDSLNLSVAVSLAAYEFYNQNL